MGKKLGNNGLRPTQGAAVVDYVCPLSPSLYSLFINDLLVEH